MRIVYILIVLILSSCTSKSGNKTSTNKIGNNAEAVKTSNIDIMNYREQLDETKKHYPFKNWRENYNQGLEQYTEENCNRTQAVFDLLIDELIGLGPDADETDKVKFFKSAVLFLNQLNNEIEGLIETGEREDLCELIDRITIAANMTQRTLQAERV